MLIEMYVKTVLANLTKANEYMIDDRPIMRAKSLLEARHDLYYLMRTVENLQETLDKEIDRFLPQIEGEKALCPEDKQAEENIKRLLPDVAKLHEMEDLARRCACHAA